jgi:hypothetical protein
MTNAIQVLYIPKYQKLNTEEQVLDMLVELYHFYLGQIRNFSCTDLTGKKIQNGEEFLKCATKKQIGENKKQQLALFQGTGRIAGLNVDNGVIIYDMSEVEILTKYWDQGCQRSCLNCRERQTRLTDQDSSKNYCLIHEWQLSSRTCGDDFKPIQTNSEGKLPRTLDKLIEEALKR